MLFNQFVETSFGDLYQNIQDAFPKTTLRQYATDPIKVVKLSILPFLGLNTLFIKGLVQNTHENTEYEPMILAKRVKYVDVKSKDTIEIVDNNGKRHLLEQLSLENTDILVRCQCKDFLYRFHHYNYSDHSLYGRDRKPYHGAGLWKANPKELPGVCKHIIKLSSALEHAKIIK